MPNTDTVTAKLTPGEFVIKKSAVDILGVPLLRKLNNLPDEGGHANMDKLISMATLANAKPMMGGGVTTPNYEGGDMVGYAGGGYMKPKKYQNGGGVSPEVYTSMVRKAISKLGGEEPEGMYTPEGGMTRAGYAKMLGADPESISIDTLSFKNPANYRFKVSGKGAQSGVDVGGTTSSMGMLPLKSNVLDPLMREKIEDPFEKMDIDILFNKIKPQGYQDGGVLPSDLILEQPGELPESLFIKKTKEPDEEEFLRVVTEAMKAQQKAQFLKAASMIPDTPMDSPPQVMQRIPIPPESAMGFSTKPNINIKTPLLGGYQDGGAVQDDAMMQQFLQQQQMMQQPQQGGNGFVPFDQREPGAAASGSWGEPGAYMESLRANRDSLQQASEQARLDSARQSLEAIKLDSLIQSLGREGELIEQRPEPFGIYEQPQSPSEDSETRNRDEYMKQQMMQRFFEQNR